MNKQTQRRMLVSIFGKGVTERKDFDKICEYMCQVLKYLVEVEKVEEVDLPSVLARARDIIMYLTEDVMIIKPCDKMAALIAAADWVGGDYSFCVLSMCFMETWRSISEGELVGHGSVTMHVLMDLIYNMCEEFENFLKDLFGKGVTERSRFDKICEYMWPVFKYLVKKVGDDFTSVLPRANNIIESMFEVDMIIKPDEKLAALIAAVEWVEGRCPFYILHMSFTETWSSIFERKLVWEGAVGHDSIHFDDFLNLICAECDKKMKLVE